MHPARGDHADRLEARIHAVLVFQAIGDDLELQRADRAEDQVVAHQRAEELGRAFLGQLRDTFLQLLQLERIAQARAAEQFGREIRDAGVRQLFADGEGVADRDRAVVVQADHVARIGRIDDLAIAGHEGQCVRELDLLAQAHMEGLHRRVVAARAHAQERDTIAVHRVHVGLDLEHESGKRRFLRLHFARGGHARRGRGRVFDEEIEQQLHAEIVDRRAEEHRRLLAGEIGMDIKRVARAFDEFEFLAHLAQHVRADPRLDARIIQRCEDR